MSAPFEEETEESDAPDAPDIWDALTSAAGPFSSAQGADGVDALTEPAFSSPEDSRYTRSGLIGTGGMGRVWSARDERLHRSVAIKELAPGASNSESLRGRLAQEAWITAQLEHPGIVPVYDAGQTPEGELYYAMRLIRGRSLQMLVESTPELSERLRWLRHILDVGEAMAYAHNMGVIHRDLKPHNIMIGEFGETQIVDWGLARPITRSPESSWRDVLPTSEEAALTLAGEVVGTPHYMSPEQARGLPATERSDVWSLGAILYALLTREPPIQGDTQAVLSRLRDPDADLESARSYDPGTPPELITITERALATSPDARYPSARDLAQDISAWLDGRRVTAYDYSRWELTRRFISAWKIPLGVAAIALILLTSLGLLSYLSILEEQVRTARAERQARTSLQSADSNLASALIEQALTLATLDAQPESETLAAHALALRESPEARGILARYDPTAHPTLITRDALPDCASHRLSSSGKHLLCEHDARGVSLWTVQPLEKRWEVAREGATDGIILDDVGQVLLRPSPELLERLDLHTGELISRAPIASGSKTLRAQGPFAVARVDPPTVLVIDARTGASFHTSHCPTSSHEPAVALKRDGSMMATYCNDSVTLHLSPLRGAPTASHPMVPEGGLSVLEFSPDGRWLAGGNTRGELLLFDVREERITLQTKTTSGRSQASPSALIARRSPSSATAAGFSSGARAQASL